MSSLGEMLTEQDIALMMGEAGALDGKVGHDDDNSYDDYPDLDHQNHGEDNYPHDGEAGDVDGKVGYMNNGGRHKEMVFYGNFPQIGDIPPTPPPVPLWEFWTNFIVV